MIQDNFSMLSGNVHDFGEKVCNLLGTPFYRGMNKPEFLPVMNAVIDNQVYFKNKALKELLDVLPIEEFTMYQKYRKIE